MKSFFNNNKYGIILILITALAIYSQCLNIYNMYNKETDIPKMQRLLEGHPPNSFDGNDNIFNVYPIMKEIVFVGDSYTEFLAYDLDYKISNFSKPGYPVSDLKDTFNKAIRTNKRYFVIFIGPNDFNLDYNPNILYNGLKECINKYKNKTNGTIILCTYLHSMHTNVLEENLEDHYKIDDYNEKILDLIDENNRIYYLDLSEKDNDPTIQRDIGGGLVDPIHFSKEFNVYFINKLYDLMIKIINNGH